MHFEACSMAWLVVEVRNITHEFHANGIRLSIFRHTHKFQDCKYSLT